MWVGFHDLGVEDFTTLVSQSFHKRPAQTGEAPIERGPTVPPAVRRGPSGPDGPRRARGDAVGSRIGPYFNCVPIRDSRATRRAPAGDYMLRAALVVTPFF